MFARYTVSLNLQSTLPSHEDAQLGVSRHDLFDPHLQHHQVSVRLPYLAIRTEIYHFDENAIAVFQRHSELLELCTRVRAEICLRVVFGCVWGVVVQHLPT